MADLPVTPLADYNSIIMSQPLAQSNIATQAASRAYLGAQTQGQALQNQLMQTRVQWLQQALNSPIVNDSQVAPEQDNSAASAVAQVGAPSTLAGGGFKQTGDVTPSGASSNPEDIASAGLDSATIASKMQQKYAVRDIWTPQEQQRLQQLQAQLPQAQQMALAGLPDQTPAIKAQIEALKQSHDIRIQNATAQAQLGAGRTYDQSVAISTMDGPPGTKLAALRRIDPQTADSIEKLAEHHSWTPEQTDTFVQTYADEIGNQSHRYSGREIDTTNKDGIPRDKQTQQPLAGGLPAGLSAQEYAGIAQEGMKRVSVPQSDGSEKSMKAYEAAGFNNLPAYVAAIAKQRAAVANAQPGAQPGAQTGTSTPGATGTAPPSTAAAQINDPVLRTALSDSEYDLAPNLRGTQANVSQSTEGKAVADARSALLADTGTSGKISAYALTYLNAAKQVLDSGGVTTGFGAQEITTINRALQKVGLGKLTNDPSKNIVLVKNLTNAALQNIKAVFGGKVTASEVFLNLDKANPNADMPDEAIRSLVDENVANAQYDVDTAHRAVRYTAAGKDPRKFDDWQLQYYPRQQAVRLNTPGAASTGGAPAAAPTGKTIVRTGTFKGRAVAEYSDGTHGYID